MVKIFLLGITVTGFVLLISGCASNAPQVAVSNNLPKEIIRIDDGFTHSIESEIETDVSSEHCSKKYEKWKKNHFWKDGVSICSSCIKNKNYEKAEEVAQEISRREIANPWGPYFQAVIARHKGNLERALWFIELAQNRAPKSGVVYYLKGQILWDQKQYDPAVSIFEKALEYDDSILPAHLLLGQVYFRDMDYKVAIEHFKKVLNKQSRNKEALKGLAWSYYELRNKDDAYREFEKLSSHEPDNGQYYSVMAEIQENHKRNLNEALNIYKMLSQKIKTGQITKNIDPELDMKMKRVENQLNRSRSVASQKESTK